LHYRGCNSNRPKEGEQFVIRVGLMPIDKWWEILNRILPMSLSLFQKLGEYTIMENRICVIDAMTQPVARRPTIRGNRVTLSGIGYEIIYNSTFRVTFLQNECKDKIIFTRESELFPWKCQCTNWMGHTVPMYMSSFQQASMILDEIVNTNRTNEDG